MATRSEAWGILHCHSIARKIDEQEWNNGDTDWAIMILCKSSRESSDADVTYEHHNRRGMKQRPLAYSIDKGGGGHSTQKIPNLKWGRDDQLVAWLGDSHGFQNRGEVERDHSVTTPLTKPGQRESDEEPATYMLTIRSFLIVPWAVWQALYHTSRFMQKTRQKRLYHAISR